MKHKASMKVSLDMAGVIVWDAVKPEYRAEFVGYKLLAENDPPEILFEFDYDDGRERPPSPLGSITAETNRILKARELREDSVSIGGTD